MGKVIYDEKEQRDCCWEIERIDLLEVGKRELFDMMEKLCILMYGAKVKIYLTYTNFISLIKEVKWRNVSIKSQYMPCFLKNK